MEAWRAHLLGFADALGLERFSIVGNSFGGGLAISMAVHAPERVDRLVLMGSVGVSFPLTDGLDAVWGYEPSLEAMRGLLDIFAFDRALVTDELARLRYAASIRPGFQESFSAMFPAPRQRGVDGARDTRGRDPRRSRTGPSSSTAATTGSSPSRTPTGCSASSTTASSTSSAAAGTGPRSSMPRSSTGSSATSCPDRPVRGRVGAVGRRADWWP